MRIVNLNQPELESCCEPTTMFVFTTQAFDGSRIRDIKTRFPDVQIFGLSSSHGILSRDGFKRGSYAFVFEKADDMPLDVKAVSFEGCSDIRKKVAEILEDWRDDSDTVEISMHATRGSEERVLEGIHDVFGGREIVFGTTPGADKFLQTPYCFLNETVLTNGTVIVRMRRHCIQAMASCYGYLSTSHTGVVTAASGRIVEKIDDRPAADVYNEWTDNMFAAYISRGGVLPTSAVLYPLGRLCGESLENGFWLAHPLSVDADNKTIQTYAEIPVGTQIYLMRGTPNSIREGVGKAVKRALANVGTRHVVAAFIMFCAASASALSNDMDSVCAEAREALGDIPFIGCTSFGEQGQMFCSKNLFHGNMMTEIILIME
ncbi:MAG: FIST C-terminal domain-containing protein [Proteobacteria bacterium]|nr:FIST C-terminal domain-containing protein [Pseudomonadota bacterium]